MLAIAEMHLWETLDQTISTIILINLKEDCAELDRHRRAHKDRLAKLASS